MEERAAHQRAHGGRRAARTSGHGLIGAQDDSPLAVKASLNGRLQYNGKRFRQPNHEDFGYDD